MKVFRFSPFSLLGDLERLAVIWVNGPKWRSIPPSWIGIWNGAKKRYCTDGASNRIMDPMKEMPGINHPDVIVGDFDSIHSESRSFFAKSSQQIYVESQDSTDLTKALCLLREDPIMESIAAILVLDSLCGRFDHVFGALNALLSYQNSTKFQLPVFVESGVDLVTILSSGESEVEVDTSKVTGVCGLIPLCQYATQVTTSGFKWNLASQVMEYGGIVSSSNQICQEKLCVRSTAPLIFTLELGPNYGNHC